MQREAARKTPSQHVGRPRHLKHLGVLLSDRYSSSRETADLGEAIQLTRESIDTTPQSHTELVGRQTCLSAYLRARYLGSGEWSTSKKPFRIQRDVVETTGPEDPNRSLYLSHLGTQLGHRYSRTKGHITDLHDSIQTLQEAVNATPQYHPDRAERLYHLGLQLHRRYIQTQDVDSLDEAIVCHQNAMSYANSPIIHQILASRALLRYLAARSRWEEAFEAASTAIRLIPQLVLRSLCNSDKQHWLGHR